MKSLKEVISSAQAEMAIKKEEQAKKRAEEARKKLGWPEAETKEQAIMNCMDSICNLNFEDGAKAPMAIRLAMKAYPQFFEAELAHPSEEDDDPKDVAATEAAMKNVVNIIDNGLAAAREKFVNGMKEVEKAAIDKVEKVATDVVNSTPADAATNMAAQNGGIGVNIDFGKLNQAFEEDAKVQAAMTAPTPEFRGMATLQQQPIPQFQMDGLPPFGTPMIPPQQPQMPPMTAELMQRIAAQQMMPQSLMVPQPMPPKPLHKVYEPPKPPKPEAKVDSAVEVDLNKINVDGLKTDPVVKKPPEFIQRLVPVSPVVPKPEENLTDNSEMIAKFSKIPLGEIQEIANQHGCNVSFLESPAQGIISVITYEKAENGGNYVTVNPKCFCIDTGMIIDKRVKLIDTCPMIHSTNPIPLEAGEFYELMSTAPKGHGRKELDKQLINDIFYAGLANITKRPMYNQTFKSLNTKVALISIPTKNLNAEERNSIYDFLIKKLMNDGYLDKALSMAPGSRFVFSSPKIEKNDLGTFQLINEGVPCFYGTMPNQVIPVIIDVNKGEVSIRSTGPEHVCTDPNCGCHH